MSLIRNLGVKGLLAVLMVILVVGFVPGRVQGAAINVDQNDGACVTGSGQTDPYAVVYCTLQDAIDDATAGDTINVAAGTYDSSGDTFPILIDKPLTLLGSQADVDPRPGQGGRSGKSVTVSGGGLTLTSLELLGGDANDDNVIDATDATLIGGEYGNSGAGIGNAAADINADDAVDILDLTLMGGNFTETSAAAYAGWTP